MTLPNESTPEIKTSSAATIAGLAYLVVFILGILANFFVFEKIIIPGNITATINNITTNQPLFRLGVASWFTVIICDALVAWALYVFLSPVNKSLAMLAAWFRIIFVAVFSYSFIPYLSVLQLFNTELTNLIEIKQLHIQVILLLKEHEFGTHVGFIFFGLHILVMGYLIFKSGYVPRILGIMLLVAGVGYLINSFGNFLSESYSESKIAFFIFVAIPAIISELSLTIWLLMKGRKL